MPLRLKKRSYKRMIYFCAFLQPDKKYDSKAVIAAIKAAEENEKLDGQVLRINYF